MTLWDYPGLSRTILVQSSLGLLETIWDYLGLSGNIFDYLGLSGSIWVQAKAGESNILLFETFSLSLFFTHAIPREARSPKKSVIQAFYNFSVMPKSALNVLFFIFL